jgi:ATP-binding cassette subfamily B protein/subfamily B ATP-binding cassette protein MsbA
MAKLHSSRQHFKSFLAKGIHAHLDQEDDEKKRAASRLEKRQHYLAEYRLWLAPYFWGLVGIFALATAAMCLEMVLPAATGRIIDSILASNEVEEAKKITTLNLWCGAILAVLIVESLMAAFRMYWMTTLNAKIVFALRERLFERLVRLPLAKIMDMKTGGIVSRLSNDVDNVTGLVQAAIISPGVAFIKVIIVLGILIYMNVKLAFAAAIMLPPLAFVSFLWVQRGRPIYRSMARDRTAVDGRVAESFGGIRVVRSFLRERKEELDYAVGHHTMIRKKIRADLYGITIDIGWSFFIPLVSLIVIWFGGFLYLSEQVTIGEIVAFQMYSALLLHPVWRIVFSLSQTQRSLASMDRVFEVLGMDEDKPDLTDAQPAPKVVETLSFNDICFEYKPGKPVLHNINLTVKGGQTIAFVGQSGAGKTTITDIIARFYDPTSGQLLLNGTDVRNIKLREYRDLFGIVEQEVFLFDGTISENISYGQRNASLEQIKEAAKRAHAHEFINTMTEGYETLIGERGIKLSGGQRQRLSIARAILADPAILILDEATSNLDTESEQYIQAGLRELFSGRTTFVIAHRLSTITHADQIVVLHEGKVVEVGTHQSLMESQGAYYEMVERQRSSFTL